MGHLRQGLSLLGVKERWRYEQKRGKNEESSRKRFRARGGYLNQTPMIIKDEKKKTSKMVLKDGLLSEIIRLEYMKQKQCVGPKGRKRRLISN